MNAGGIDRPDRPPCYGEWHRTDEDSWFRFLGRGDEGELLFRLGPAPFWEASVHLRALEAEPFACASCGLAFSGAGTPVAEQATASVATLRTVHFEVIARHDTREDGGRGEVDPDSVSDDVQEFRRVHSAWVGTPSQAMLHTDEDGLRIYGVWGGQGRARLEERAEPLGDGRWRTTFQLWELPPEVAHLLPTTETSEQSLPPEV